jgi:hypothetical protein
MVESTAGMGYWQYATPEELLQDFALFVAEQVDTGR